MNNPKSHNHTFSDPYTYALEDILVVEFLECESEHCDFVKPIQWEVEVTSFVKNEKSVPANEGEKLWREICDYFKAPLEITSQKHSYEQVEIKTESGETVIFNYKNTSLKNVELTLNGDTISFETTFYRELDETSRRP